VCPKLRYVNEPKGTDKIVAARAAGAEISDLEREASRRKPTTQYADLEGDGFYVRFFLGPDEDLVTLDVEVWGDTQRAIQFLQFVAAQLNLMVAEGGRGEQQAR